MSIAPLTHQQTADLCHSMAQLLHSGFPAADSCALLAEGETGAVKSLLSELEKQLDSGASLGEAFLDQDSFPRSTAALILAGEQTGYLLESLHAAARFHRQQMQTIRQLRSALGYPLILFLLMLVVIGVLLIYVMPVFNSVYASLGAPMTGAAAAFLAFGQSLEDALPFIFLLLLLTGIIGILYRFSSAVRYYLTGCITRLTDDRWLYREIMNMRFIQAMSMAISGGLVPEEAIQLASATLPESSGAYDRCNRCLSLIHAGADVSQALESMGFLDRYGYRMLSLSFKAGNTDQVMAELAQRMEEQTTQKIREVLERIEPAMVVICSLLVGIILLTVMLPLLQVLSSLG